MEKDPGAVTRIFRGSAYTPDAINEIMPLVYDELRRLASHFLRGERQGHTLMTTGLVHEAYFRLFGLERISFQNRRHFFATAAMAMRRILVDHARRRAAGHRIPPEAQVPLDVAPEAAEERPLEILALDRALEALAAVSDRQARIVELRYFGGLTEAQLAEVLGVSRATVARDVRVAKLWLRREMRGG